MQSNSPYGVNDLDVIRRLYRKQNKIEKSYRVTYQSKDGKKDFIGAADKSELDEKIKELKYHDHKILDINILKSKIYIQNPSEAPQGSKILTGKHGGKYYESRTITAPIMLRMRNIESYTNKILETYNKLSKNELGFEEKIIFANNLLNLYNKNKKHADHLDVPKKDLEDTIQLLSSNDIHDKVIGIDNFMGLAHYSDLFLLSLIQDEYSKNRIPISDEELDEEWKWKEQLTQSVFQKLNEIRNRKGLEARTFRRSSEYHPDII